MMGPTFMQHFRFLGLIAAAALLAAPAAFAQLSQSDVINQAVKKPQQFAQSNSGSSGYQGNYQDERGSYYAAPLALPPRAPTPPKQESREERGSYSSAPPATAPRSYTPPTRGMVDLDEYSITEDDLLAASENGVINVNNIPDPRSQRAPQPPGGELCCPPGTSYFLGICASTRTGMVDHTPGTRRTPNGQCTGSRPL